jgi:hypothetical protein
MRNIVLLISLLFCFYTNAQNDLLSLLNEDEGPIYSSYLFKGTKVVNGQSVESPSINVLQFNIQHRFGPLNSGLYNLYGLDYAQVRFSLEYGLKEWVSLGVGRSSVSKTIDGNIKARIKRQVKGSKKFPFTLVLNSAIYLQQYTFNQQSSPYFLFTDQLIYTHQLLLARKINRNLSFQITPTFIHFNVIDHSKLIRDTDIKNDNVSLGVGGRQKITKRISVNAETFFQLDHSINNNVMSIGFDIETGGHIFQLHLSNSPAMIEPLFITKTYGDFFNGDIYFGFNISRVFNLKK